MATRPEDLQARMAAAMAQPDAARAQQHMPQPDAPLTLEALRASPLGMLLEAAIAPLGVAGGAVDAKRAWQDRSPFGGILAALAMLPGPMVPGGNKAAKGARAAWETERDVLARTERLAGSRPRGTYDEIQKLIDSKETLLERQGWNPIKDPITDPDLQRLYDERDAVGALDDEGVFALIAERIPDGPAPKEFLVEHARQLFDSYTQSERLSGKVANLKPEDVQSIAQGLYTTVLHKVSPGGYGYPGDLMHAIEVSRDFGNSGWGRNPKPLLEQVFGTLRAFGLDAGPKAKAIPK